MLQYYYMSFTNTSFSSKKIYPNSVRIGLMNPDIAQTWAQRVVSDGTTIASIKKGDTINHTTSQPIATGLFCQSIFGPCIDYTCACGHEKIRIHVNVNVSPPICPECHVEWTESSVRRQRLGSIELISPVTHKWFSDSRNYIPILAGITAKTFKSLKECKLFFPFSLQHLESEDPKHLYNKEDSLNDSSYGASSTLGSKKCEEGKAQNSTVLNQEKIEIDPTRARAMKMLQFVDKSYMDSSNAFTCLDKTNLAKNKHLENKTKQKSQEKGANFSLSSATIALIKKPSAYDKGGSQGQKDVYLTKNSPANLTATSLCSLGAKAILKKKNQNFYFAIATTTILKKKKTRNEKIFRDCSTAVKTLNNSRKNNKFCLINNDQIIQSQEKLSSNVFKLQENIEIRSWIIKNIKQKLKTSGGERTLLELRDFAVIKAWQKTHLETASLGAPERNLTLPEICIVRYGKEIGTGTRLARAQKICDSGGRFGRTLPILFTPRSLVPDATRSGPTENFLGLKASSGQNTQIIKKNTLNQGFSSDFEQKKNVMPVLKNLVTNKNDLLKKNTNNPSIETSSAVKSESQIISETSFKSKKTIKNNLEYVLLLNLPGFSFKSWQSSPLTSREYFKNQVSFERKALKQHKLTACQYFLKGGWDEGRGGLLQRAKGGKGGIEPYSLSSLPTLGESPKARGQATSSFTSLRLAERTKQGESFRTSYATEKGSRAAVLSPVGPESFKALANTLKSQFFNRHACFPIRPSFTQPEDYRRQFIKFIGNNGYIKSIDIPIARYTDQTGLFKFSQNFSTYKSKYKNKKIDLVSNSYTGIPRPFANRSFNHSKRSLYPAGLGGLEMNVGFVPLGRLRQSLKLQNSIAGTNLSLRGVLQKSNTQTTKLSLSLCFARSARFKLDKAGGRHKAQDRLNKKALEQENLVLGVSSTGSAGLMLEPGPSVFPEGRYLNNESRIALGARPVRRKMVGLRSSLPVSPTLVASLAQMSTSVLCKEVYVGNQREKFDFSDQSLGDTEIPKSPEKKYSTIFTPLYAENISLGDKQHPNSRPKINKIRLLTLQGVYNSTINAPSIIGQKRYSRTSNLTAPFSVGLTRKRGFRGIKPLVLSAQKYWAKNITGEGSYNEKCARNVEKRGYGPIAVEGISPISYSWWALKKGSKNAALAERPSKTISLRQGERKETVSNREYEPLIDGGYGRWNQPVSNHAEQSTGVHNSQKHILLPVNAKERKNAYLQKDKSFFQSPLEVYFSDTKSQAKEQTVKNILSYTGGGGLQKYLSLLNLKSLVLVLQNDLFEIAPRLAKSQSTRRILLQILNETFRELNQTYELQKKVWLGESTQGLDPKAISSSLDYRRSTGTRNQVKKAPFGIKSTSSAPLEQISTQDSVPERLHSVHKEEKKKEHMSKKVNLSNRKASDFLSKFKLKSTGNSTNPSNPQDLVSIESLEKKYKDIKKEYRAVKKICSDFQNRKNANKRRYKLAFQLLRTMSNPAGMTISSIPVLPPGLRPIIDVPKIGPITADLNIRYRGLIFALRNLRELAYVDFRNAGAAQASVQEAVDDLLYTGGKTRSSSSPGPNLYKSLAMRLKGKHGRFRGNLLGKRVDYSGRSVIVVGPTLKIHQCGLPFEIAIKLFTPFLIRRLIQKGLCKNVYKAKQVLLEGKFKPLIWALCREVMLEHLVLLNRAPTLHRLGVQAFMPILISGRAILLHPLVCTGFNADFDGDQMGVHVPLFPHARAEAWKMMWSRNNFLSPSSGEPILLPSQDMVLGCYYLTESFYSKALTPKLGPESVDSRSCANYINVSATLPKFEKTFIPPLTLAKIGADLNTSPQQRQIQATKFSFLPPSQGSVNLSVGPFSSYSFGITPISVAIPQQGTKISSVARYLKGAQPKTRGTLGLLLPYTPVIDPTILDAPMLQAQFSHKLNSTRSALAEQDGALACSEKAGDGRDSESIRAGIYNKNTIPNQYFTFRKYSFVSAVKSESQMISETSLLKRFSKTARNGFQNNTFSLSARGTSCYPPLGKSFWSLPSDLYSETTSPLDMEGDNKQLRIEKQKLFFAGLRDRNASLVQLKKGQSNSPTSMDSHSMSTFNCSLFSVKSALDGYRRGFFNIQSSVWIYAGPELNISKKKHFSDLYEKNRNRITNGGSENWHIKKMEGDGILTPALELRITPYGITQLVQISGSKKSIFSRSILLPCKKKLKPTFEMVSARTTIGRLLFNDVLQKLEIL